MAMGLIVLLVFSAGCAGGLVNSLIAGGLQLPGTDRSANVYRPGWLGNVAVGGVAALVFWGLYGPFSKALIVGGASAPAISLSLGELFGSLVTGIGGGRLLTSEIDKRALKNQKDALAETKNTLSEKLLTTVREMESK
jgi:hypothetical protein